MIKTGENLEDVVKKLLEGKKNGSETTNTSSPVRTFRYLMESNSNSPVRFRYRV